MNHFTIIVEEPIFHYLTVHILFTLHGAGPHRAFVPNTRIRGNGLLGLLLELLVA